MKNHLSKTQCIEVYQIDTIFFDAIVDAGLIEIVQYSDDTYISYDNLQHFEQFINWHYDLEINIAGLEVIAHLLQKIRHLQQAQRSLKLPNAHSTIIG
jgi:chaperone modulatory protein CbpM